MTTAWRVDTHHHVWNLAARDQVWVDPATMSALRRDFDLAELQPQATAAGVDRTVLVQTLPVPEETPELLRLAAESPLVAAVVGWVDLTAAGVADELSRLRRHGGALAGIRHPAQDESDRWWLARPNVQRGLRAVAEAGLVYELLVVPRNLDAAIETARALPEVTFVLDHAGKPPVVTGEIEPWASRIRTLAALPNVVCKLSGLVTEADWHTWTVAEIRRYTDIVLESFGPRRVMFGSDWPVCLLAADYAGVVELADQLTSGMDEAERAHVFRHTAERVYQLDV